MQILKIIYSKSSEKFLNKNKHLITEEKTDSLIVKAVKNLLYKGNENIDLKKMKGTFDNQYRIRIGKIRILFMLTNGVITVANVENIGFRGDVYK